jgi:tellurium resistance protein TerD
MEPLNLQKLEKLNLSKASTVAPLHKLSLGAGWDPATEGKKIDIDLSAFALRNGKLVSANDICYFDNKSILGGAIVSMGDNLTGEGDGDDETINVDLTAVPADVDTIIVLLNIFGAQSKGQYFSGVKNAFVRAYNTDTNEELAKTNVSGSVDHYDSLVFAKAVRVGDEWEFVAIQDFHNGDLNALAAKFE